MVKRSAKIKTVGDRRIRLQGQNGILKTGLHVLPVQHVRIVRVQLLIVQISDALHQPDVTRRLLELSDVNGLILGVRAGAEIDP